MQNLDSNFLLIWLIRKGFQSQNNIEVLIIRYSVVVSNYTELPI